MGRPLAKRFFGNTNAPPVAGEGIASFTVGGTNNNYTANPTISSIGAPNLPGGVQAVGAIASMTVKAISSVAGTTTAAYLVGDTLTYTRAGDSAAATFTVATLAGTSVIASVTIAGTAGQLTVTSGTYYKGQSIQIVGALTNGAIVGYNPAGTTYYIVANVTAGTSIQITDTYANAIAGTAALTSTANASAIAATSTLNGGTGSGAQQAAGPVATVTIATAGTFPVATALETGARSTTSSGSGAGATLTLAYGILAASVSTAGSGYSSAPTVTLSGGNGALTAVLSTGNVNAILVTADTGNGDAAADVIKQVGSRRYKVTDGTTTAICKLAATGTLAVGEMSIVAYDSGNGGSPSEYYVTKLTRHRARLTQKTDGGSGYEFATGQSVPWNLDAAVLNTSVKLANA